MKEKKSCRLLCYISDRIYAIHFSTWRIVNFSFLDQEHIGDIDDTFQSKSRRITTVKRKEILDPGRIF